MGRRGCTGSAWTHDGPGTTFDRVRTNVKCVTGQLEIRAKTPHALTRKRDSEVNLPAGVAGPPGGWCGWLPPSPQPSPSGEREEEEPRRRSLIPGSAGARKTPDQFPPGTWEPFGKLRAGSASPLRPLRNSSVGARKTPHRFRPKTAEPASPLGEGEDPERLRGRGCAAQRPQQREASDGRLGVRGLINVIHERGL